MAYGTTLKKGSTVTTSRDSSRAARALKRAMMAGLNAAGVNVDDLEVAPVPVTRFQVRSACAARGASRCGWRPTTRSRSSSASSMPTALDIDETAQRKIERLYYREDFRRAFAADIGDIGFPPRAIEYYTAALMRTVDADAIRGAGFKVVLDYAYGTTSFVMPNVLAKLGADVLGSTPTPRRPAPPPSTWPPTPNVSPSSCGPPGRALAAVIDPDGEHITLIDDEGHVLTDDEALLTLVTLVTSPTEKAHLALPCRS